MSDSTNGKGKCLVKDVENGNAVVTQDDRSYKTRNFHICPTSLSVLKSLSQTPRCLAMSFAKMEDEFLGFEIQALCDAKETGSCKTGPALAKKMKKLHNVMLGMFGKNNLSHHSVHIKTALTCSGMSPGASMTRKQLGCRTSGKRKGGAGRRITRKKTGGKPQYMFNAAVNRRNINPKNIDSVTIAAKQLLAAIDNAGDLSAAMKENKIKDMLTQIERYEKKVQNASKTGGIKPNEMPAFKKSEAGFNEIISTLKKRLGMAETPVPEQPQPAVPEEAQPAVPEEAQPAVPEEAQPAVAEQPQPAVAEQPQPAVPEQVQPTVAEQAQPAVAEQPQPTVAEQPQPAVAEQPQPAVPEQVQPTVAEQPQPTVAEEAQPAVPEQAEEEEQPVATEQAAEEEQPAVPEQAAEEEEQPAATEEPEEAEEEEEEEEQPATEQAEEEKEEEQPAVTEEAKQEEQPAVPIQEQQQFMPVSTQITNTPKEGYNELVITVKIPQNYAQTTTGNTGVTYARQIEEMTKPSNFPKLSMSGLRMPKMFQKKGGAKYTPKNVVKSRNTVLRKKTLAKRHRK